MILYFQGPYGNYTLEDFVNLAEHLVQSSIKDSATPSIPNNQVNDEVIFDEDAPNFLKKNIGTAKAKVSSSPSLPHQNGGNTVSNTQPLSENRKTNKQSSNLHKIGKRSSPPVNLTDPSQVPLDVSNYSKPSRLDVVLPEFIVDHVESYNTTKDVQTEEDRAEAHKKLQKQIEKALEAMKRLQDSYKHLYEQISQAKTHFPMDDPAHKSLDDILASAVVPASVLPDDLIPSLSTNDNSTQINLN